MTQWPASEAEIDDAGEDTGLRYVGDVLVQAYHGSECAGFTLRDFAGERLERDGERVVRRGLPRYRPCARCEPEMSALWEAGLYGRPLSRDDRKEAERLAIQTREEIARSPRPLVQSETRPERGPTGELIRGEA